MDLPSAEGRALCGLCWRVWEVTAAAGARKPNFSSLFVYLFICCFRSWFQCLTLQVRGERCYGLQPSVHLYITAGRTAGSCRSRRCHQDFSLFETLRFQVRFLNQQSRCFISVPGRCSCWQESLSPPPPLWIITKHYGLACCCGLQPQPPPTPPPPVSRKGTLLGHCFVHILQEI